MTNLLRFSGLTRKKRYPFPLIRKINLALNALKVQPENTYKPGIKNTVHPLPLAKILTHMQIDLQWDIQFHD